MGAAIALSHDDIDPNSIQIPSFGHDDIDPRSIEPAQSGTPGKAQTFLEHAGNALTFGYLPQLQAAAEPVMTRILNQATGNKVEPDNYVTARDSNAKRLGAEATANPKTALAGSLSGGLLGAAVTPIPGAAGGGLMKLAGKGALYGGAVGALSNPGETEGKVDPLQLEDRAQNAGKGVLIGATGGAVAGAAAKGMGMLANSPKAVNSFAEQKAFKGAGAMLKDFRTANDKGQVQDLGRFMLDNKIIQAGDTFDDVAMKAKQFNQQAGQKLDQIYSDAEKAIGTDKPIQSGFNPVRDKAAILGAAKDKLGDAVGGKQAIAKLSGYLDDLGEKYGPDTTLNPRQANDIKGAIDNEINYSRNPLNKQPEVEKAFSAARKQIAEKIEQHIDELGKATGNPDAAQGLKQANREYGQSAQVSNIAKDRMSRESANRMFGLTDTIAGSAGGAAAGAAGAALSGDSKHAAGAGVAGMLAGAVGNKLGRTYGNGLLAAGANSAAPALKYSVQPIGQVGQMLTSNPGLLNEGFIRGAMVPGKQGLKQAENVPPGLLQQTKKNKPQDRSASNQ